MIPNRTFDTDWIQCTPFSEDITLVDWNPLMYKIINQIMYIQGTVTIAKPDWNKPITQLPYEFQSEVDAICRASGTNNKLATCALAPNGVLSFLETSVDATNVNTTPTVFINMAVPIKNRK